MAVHIIRALSFISLATSLGLTRLLTYFFRYVVTRLTPHDGCPTFSLSTSGGRSRQNSLWHSLRRVTSRFSAPRVVRLWSPSASCSLFQDVPDHGRFRRTRRSGATASVAGSSIHSTWPGLSHGRCTVR